MRLGSTPTAFLDVVLTCFHFAPRQNDYTLVVECRYDVVPIRDDFQARIVSIASSLKHVFLDCCEEGRDTVLDVCYGQWGFDAIVAAYGQGLLLRNVGRADFETQRNTLRIRVNNIRYYKEQCSTFCSQSLNLYPGV